MTTIYVRIEATKGSAPRDAGTVMGVTATDTVGTIGGGALEFASIASARRMLHDGSFEARETIPLGSRLGQCCGGAVTLHYTRTPTPIDVTQDTPPVDVMRTPFKSPLWVWGAGHVGRSVVRTAAATQAFDITWVDKDIGRFPASGFKAAQQVPAHDMPRLAAHAPQDAMHLILTYSHDIDLALCAALSTRGFAYCGLIGSKTKWARFRKKLLAALVDPDGITCPIGDKNLGKHPDLIAYGTVKALLTQLRLEATA